MWKREGDNWRNLWYTIQAERRRKSFVKEQERHLIENILCLLRLLQSRGIEIYQLDGDGALEVP